MAAGVGPGLNIWYNIPLTVGVEQVVPNDAQIVTQLPRDIVIQRVVLAVLCGAGACLAKFVPFYVAGLVVVLTSAFALYTLYQHIIKPDPLVAAFYRAAGGEDSYNQLPLIQSFESPSTALARGVTKDNRRILYVNGATIDENHQTQQRVFVFIEKVHYQDLEDQLGFNTLLPLIQATLNPRYHQRVQKERFSSLVVLPPIVGGNTTSIRTDLVQALQTGCIEQKGGVMNGRLLNELLYQHTHSFSQTGFLTAPAQ